MVFWSGKRGYIRPGNGGTILPKCRTATGQDRAGRGPTIEQLRATLGADEASLERLERLAALGPPDFAVTLPSADALPAALLELAIPHEEINTLVALLPTPDGTPELWWLLERCTHALVRAMGQIDEPLAFPVLPSQLGAVQRYFYCYVFLAVLPHLRAIYHARAIPDDVLRATVADLGRGMAIYRRRYGEGGLGGAFWPALHFRGALFQLGRLQFQRVRLDGRIGQEVRDAGLPYGPGSPALDVHIPDFSGPLSPSACDASFARAKAFFARHFPDERPGVALCDSWLLDEQLAAYLPAEANIVRFQRRFRDIQRSGEDDGFMIAAVFGRSDLALDALPQRTTLERAIVGHLKGGGRWYSGLGWCAP